MNLSDDNTKDNNYHLSEEGDKEEEDEVDNEVQEDDIWLDDLDPVEDSAMAPHQ